MQLDDTIAAIATASGQAGIGILRISGPNARAILDKVFVPAHAGDFVAQQMRYGRIINDGEVLDEGLAVLFCAPLSYTCQDVVEIHVHGGGSVVRVLEVCLAKGARLAQPGEFTKRAFLNGRLDLAQAEAVMDVISSSAAESTRAALSQLGGQLSQKVGAWQGRIIHLRAQIEVTLDYPEEDYAPDIHGILAEMQHLIDEMKAALKAAHIGQILRQGARCALVGKPNVGKSALMNALLGCPRALVTAMPGTTRDVLTEMLDIDGVPMMLMDTAGLRKGGGEIERMGMERTQQAMQSADILLWAVDGTMSLTAQDKAIRKQCMDAVLQGAKCVIALNKSDLPCCVSPDELVFEGASVVTVSALTAQGLPDLLAALKQACIGTHGQEVLLSRKRHAEAVQRCVDSLETAKQAAKDGFAPDLWCADLSDAHDHLCAITGQNATEDLLDHVFLEFCLGK